MNNKKSLVIYFSRADENCYNGTMKYVEKGNTEIIAEMVRDLIGADLFKVEPAVPYSKEYRNCLKESRERIGNAKIKAELHDISPYEIIYVMSPIYWGTYAPEMETCLKNLDFTGKKVRVLTTHEGSGLGNTVNDVKRVCNGAIVLPDSLAITGSKVLEARPILECWLARRRTKLSNGVEIPLMGIGTFKMEPAVAEASVREALKEGYRLIDTANSYVNERAVGRAIMASGIPRDDLFVSTKLWVSEYENPHAVEDTLERLGLQYIDLLFLHHPSGNYLNGYKLLEKAYNEGKIKAIGLSNFEGKYLDDILANCTIKPHVLQAERHPYFTGKDMNDKLNKEGIKTMSWFPLGHGDGNLLNEPVFSELSTKYGKKPVQIILRWHVQMGFIVIPGSKTTNHIKDNYDIFDFNIEEEDMKKIALLDVERRYYELTDEKLEKFSMSKPQYEEDSVVIDVL